MGRKATFSVPNGSLFYPTVIKTTIVANTNVVIYEITIIKISKAFDIVAKTLCHSLVEFLYFINIPLLVSTTNMIVDIMAVRILPPIAPRKIAITVRPVGTSGDGVFWLFYCPFWLFHYITFFTM